MSELEGVIRIYNRSDKMVNDLINGTRVIVPPRGSVETSARRASVMLERHPGVLTQDASYAKQSCFKDEHFKAIEDMDEVHLRACIKIMMSGGVPDIMKAYEDQRKAKK